MGLITTTERPRQRGGLKAGCAVEIALQQITPSDPSSYRQEQEVDSYLPKSHQRLIEKNGTLEHMLLGSFLLRFLPRAFVTGHG
jgi:hypothetical protein